MFPRPARNEIHVIHSRLDSSPKLNLLFRQFLSRDEQERADRYRFAKDRDAFVAARGLLRMILSNYVGTEPADLTFQYGSHGKPALAGFGEITFNLSRSGGAVIYAVAPGDQLGVDLEYIRELEDMEKIAERYFNVSEYHELLATPRDSRGRAFFNCWTRKEAFVKVLGEGLSHPLDRFRVTLQPGEPARLVDIDGRSSSETGWALYDVAATDDYAAALAVKNPNSRVQIWRFASAAECADFCQSQHSPM